jgi:putative transposase
VKKKRLSVEQITAVLKQAEGGIPVGDVCRQAGVSEQTFYRCRIVADLTLDKVMLQDIVQKKF